MAQEMPHLATLGSVVAIPNAPNGWHEYSYAVLMDGTLALLRTDRDVRTELSAWYSKMSAGEPHAPYPVDLWSGRARLSVFDGKVEREPVELPMLPYPHVDRCADGNWVIATSRTGRYDRNAHVYAPDGTRLANFFLGDGIAHLRCTPDGSIWVGYFDEGVFTSDVDSNGRPHVSAAGIARFTADGTVLWRYNDSELGPAIDDCYAMTRQLGVIWACPYSDFPVLRIEDGQVVTRKNNVDGARAIAVADNYIALAGGYNEQKGRIALLRLGKDHAHLLGEVRFDPPSPYGCVQGQGEVLHVVRPGSWMRIDVATLVQALSPVLER